MGFDPPDTVTVIYNRSNPVQSRVAENGMTTIGGVLFEAAYMGFLVVLAAWFGVSKLLEGLKAVKSSSANDPTSLSSQ
jgi:hypothetical protein